MKTKIILMTLLASLSLAAHAQKESQFFKPGQIQLSCQQDGNQVVLRSNIDMRSLNLQTYERNESSFCHQAIADYVDGSLLVCATNSSGATLINTLSGYQLVFFASRSDCLESRKTEIEGFICAIQGQNIALIKMYPQPKTIYNFGGASLTAQASQCRKAQFEAITSEIKF